MKGEISQKKGLTLMSCTTLNMKKAVMSFSANLNKMLLKMHGAILTVTVCLRIVLILI